MNNIPDNEAEQFLNEFRYLISQVGCIKIEFVEPISQEKLHLKCLEYELEIFDLFVTNPLN